jgi:2-keto-4-pentenoate hydratase/2-oxohepta-3-ene-1,7-dioic acid hydratase in catechol pathway
MKFVVFNEGRPGLLTDRGVVDLSSVTRPLGHSAGHDAMQALISHYDELKPELTRLAAEGEATPLANVTLQSPVPRAKVLAMGGNYRENGHREPSPMWGFLKSTDSITGPGATVVLPPDVDANIFHHEAELVVVFGKAGDHIPEAQAMDYVFGFTCGVDVSARMPPRAPGGGGIDRTKMPISAGKSYPGFSPIGPCIATKDEVGDPEKLDVKLYVSGELRPNYNTSDLAHSIAESIAWATAITPVEPGDVLYMGTNHQGLGALQDGDTVDIEITNIGRMSFKISDPAKRRWPKGVDEVTAADVRGGTGAGPGSKSRPLA